ncbi:abnormal spindle-like microcephaly-associated protein homolog, partial [Phalaenopsis equestris]|uniref:abnormal spindle-like microcephaly-associated protein homolog n=1 Tax=Phalaenopsis equestris TaxID=78828 RepID=UPI0009E5FC82
MDWFGKDEREKAAAVECGWRTGRHLLVFISMEDRGLIFTNSPLDQSDVDSRRQPERGGSAASPQPHFSTPSHLLWDTTNVKTPRPYPRNPNPIPSLTSPSPLFFTASKKTPYLSYSTPTSSTSHSIFRRHKSSVAISSSRSKTALRLKVLELEQSRSARKALIRREKSLERCSRSLTAWINFLLQNPKDCGCKIGPCADDGQPLGSFSKGKGKRESLDGGIIEIGRNWRSPKRQRVQTDAVVDINLSMVKQVPFLKKSLDKVCSFEDMVERMLCHMSSKSCNEVLLMMTQVCKNIDEGRLKMKSHCPLVTDLAIRERAIKILLCYNSLWLQIGLHILFGGDSLLVHDGDQDEHFLKEFIEKHFLTHAGIVRTHALNKLVGGLYRPGYYEALGSVILKRFFLLVISLDKSKCESSLPIKHGIDSIDGGSPLLFARHSPIKSSRQIIHEFLADSMHGEGDLLAHLVILGCKVNHQQSPFCEFEFKVKNIFEDLQDGILLCRMVQLLQCNQTIFSKLVSPDTPKKKLQNCSTAMQYLKDSGVHMLDSDGVMLTATDIANGDKELTCSILWNVFVQLQVPLLINRTTLLKEIVKIKGFDVEYLKYNSINEMNLLLHWIQAICATQNIEVQSFSSLTDGRALICLIKSYFGNDIHQLLFEKENEDEYNDDRIRKLDCLSPTLVDIAIVQSVTTMLGKSPEILHLCDIFDEGAYFDERSAVILLVFLASRLITSDKLDIVNSFRFPQQACQSPLRGCSSISRLFHLQSDPHRPKNNLKELFCLHNNEGFDRYTVKGSSARVIQTRFRGFIERRNFLKMKMSTILLQSVVKAWLTARFETYSEYGTPACSALPSTNGIYDRYLTFFKERHRFCRTRKAVILIQRFVRAWFRRKLHTVNFMKSEFNATEIPGEIIVSCSCCHNISPRDFTAFENIEKRATMSEGNKTFELQLWAATKIQEVWKNFVPYMHSKRSSAAIKIQSRWRCWSNRKNYLRQLEAIQIIQSAFLCMMNRKVFRQKHIAANEIQRFIRGQIARTKLLGASNHQFRMLHQRSYDVITHGFVNNVELRIVIGSVIKLQRWWKRILLHKSTMHAAISIQSSLRGWIARSAAAKRKQNICIIQRLWRNILLSRRKKSSVIVIQACIRGWITGLAVAHKKYCILKIQRWWRNILFLRTRKASVLTIQAHVRGWIARRKAARNKHGIVLIQSYWKGFLIRKQSRPQLLNLRHRMKLSAANVNDEMRLINKLVVALSELLGHKSISNIRHTCSTLDIATELSQKCCETLVDAGAIDILLRQIQLLNRGIPDQEVLKHVLSTLRNIVRY